MTTKHKQTCTIIFPTITDPNREAEITSCIDPETKKRVADAIQFTLEYLLSPENNMSHYWAINALDQSEQYLTIIDVPLGSIETVLATTLSALVASGTNPKSNFQDPIVLKNK